MILFSTDGNISFTTEYNYYCTTNVKLSILNTPYGFIIPVKHDSLAIYDYLVDNKPMDILFSKTASRHILGLVLRVDDRSVIHIYEVNVYKENPSKPIFVRICTPYVYFNNNLSIAAKALMEYCKDDHKRVIDSLFSSYRDFNPSKVLTMSLDEIGKLVYDKYPEGHKPFRLDMISFVKEK